jgi:hypothetical protein
MEYLMNPKRFGAWTKHTARERAEYLQELRDNLKNGPVTISHVMDQVSDEMPDAEEPPTHEGK